MVLSIENKAKKVTIVVFSGDLDRALAAFIIATGAASMGFEVVMYFTFWGLNVLKKNEGSIPASGFLRKVLSRMNRGGTRRLPLSRMDMYGASRKLMKKFMRESRVPTIDDFIGMAKSMGVKMIACTTSMGVMGVPKEFLRPEADTVAGVATYLGNASEANINLFI
jgi:peroxiredoxin family protein